MYLTYEEYTNMGGTLDEAAFDDLEFEAESLINWRTFNRLKKEEQQSAAVKRLMLYLIKYLKIKSDTVNGSTADGQASGGAVVASQSNDGVSKSFAVVSASELLKTAQSEIDSAISRYLDGVANSLGQYVLYRGIYPNE